MSGSVYQILCIRCDNACIRETRGSLGILIKEHLTGKPRGNHLTTRGKHGVEVHNGNDFDIKYKILQCKGEVLLCKTLEALWISTRNSSMNIKN